MSSQKRGRPRTWTDAEVDALKQRATGELGFVIAALVELLSRLEYMQTPLSLPDRQLMPQVEKLSR